MLRRICTCVLSLLIASAATATPSPPRDEWPAWEQFAKRFMQADGRVIDITFDGKSTSEGQSYALFFALVANQPERFQTILKWSNDNLADGQLGERLPGWLWGKRDDGSWGIKDRNAASDADLWFAYTLLEAGRLWHQPQYDALGKRLLTLIKQQEIVNAGAAGTLLLPGPIGFALADGRYRVNPSYLPGFMFTYFASVDGKKPWLDVWQSYQRLAPSMFASGVAPDNVIVNSKGKVFHDTERTPSGSYDAIRVYLWAGMSKDNSELLRLLSRYAKLVRTEGVAPEKVNPINGAALRGNYSPIGYAGALLPYLSALREPDLLDREQQRVQRDLEQARRGHSTNYYDQVLILFGTGWVDRFYRFDDSGRLVTKWSMPSESLTANESASLRRNAR